MHRWQLSIQIAASRVRLHATRRRFARQLPLLAALAALALTLALGRGGAPLPLFRGAPIELAGLAAVAGFGLLAWHCARLTVLPLAESATAALFAALIPVLLFPGLGENALVVPVAASLLLAWRDPGQRVVVLLVQCGALAAAAGSGAGDFASGFSYATMLGCASFLAARSLSGAANDNPSMERAGQIQRLPQSVGYASPDSISGKWGVS